MRSGVGIVAIGRNEGDRLARCLASLGDWLDVTVYVDSGSTDGSVERAKKSGARVVELDESQPYSAARARNAGFQELVRAVPGLRFVQFVDGDCELQPAWIAEALLHLDACPDLVAVYGRRRERFREASLYNRLMDMEWDTPVGEESAFGGDVMLATQAFRAVGGYDERLIAGEDPELCMRLRRAGYRTKRLDFEMTLHDAAMMGFSQWWRRSVRAGHAYAQSAFLHGGEPGQYCVRQVGSVLAWGFGLPVLALGGTWATGGMSLWLVCGYGVLWGRVYRSRIGKGDSRRDRALYGLACTIGKFAQLWGALKFFWTRLLWGRASTLIEYKGPESGEGRPS